MTKKYTDREILISTHELTWIILLLNLAIIAYLGLTEYRLNQAAKEMEKAEQAIEQIWKRY